MLIQLELGHLTLNNYLRRGRFVIVLRFAERRDDRFLLFFDHCFSLFVSDLLLLQFLLCHFRLWQFLIVADVDLPLNLRCLAIIGVEAFADVALLQRLDVRQVLL